MLHQIPSVSDDAYRRIRRTAAGYEVPGVAEVSAPHRGRLEAFQVAARISAEPEAYLSVIHTFHVPGVIDKRWWRMPTRTSAIGGNHVKV